MRDYQLIRAWLRQANADLDAARDSSGALACHRRYWLQQACEKGIKALGAILWNGPAAYDKRFRSEFLYKHSPLKNLRETPGIPKPLSLLLRELEAELRRIDGHGLLAKVDSTTPTTDAMDVSYRYPFVDSSSGDIIAPVDFRGWDAYQGNEGGVISAVDRFLKAVRNRSKLNRVSD